MLIHDFATYRTISDITYGDCAQRGEACKLSIKKVKPVTGSRLVFMNDAQFAKWAEGHAILQTRLSLITLQSAPYPA